MNDHIHRRMAWIVLLSLSVFVVTSAWCVHHVYLLAKDLPNRIQIEMDGEMLGDMITESMRVSLRDGDQATQLGGLRAIRDGMWSDVMIPLYIQQNFGDEILPLCESENTEVAALASEIAELAGLFAQTESDVDLVSLGMPATPSAK